MRRPSRRTLALSIFGASLLGVVPLACGSSESSTFTPGGGTETDGGAPPDATLGTTGPGFGTGPGTSECASRVLCGAAATCCAAGEECVEGACGAACASGVRCGGSCCAAGQVCLSGACTVPGKACGDSFDCDESQFCEPTLGKCLPQPTGASACEYRPPVAPLAPKEEWSWTGSTIQPTLDQVIAIPAVLDVDKDGVPEVFVVTGGNFQQTGPAVLRRLDGKTGAEEWTDAALPVYQAANYVNPRSTPAAADLEGDGKVAIVVGKSNGGLIAFNTDGTVRWTSQLAGDAGPYVAKWGGEGSVTVAIADMNNDGKAEIVAGSCIFDAKGVLVRCIGPDNQGGSNKAGYGPVSIIADLDGDDTTTDQQLVTGNAVYRMDGSPVWSLNAAEFPDGFPAVADLDKDGTPELVVVSRSNLRVHNALTGALLARYYLTDKSLSQSDGSNYGGPPTIADFDGDGKMDIATAGGYGYFVFGYDAGKPAWSGGYVDGGPLGTLDAGGAGPSTAGRLLLKWFKETQDLSSNVTGSSVFDFEGDGKSEVVYQDECYARVYRGTDGETLYEVANSSATIFEYPVLVDVDGDNNTEFVVVANDLNHKSGSPKCYGRLADGGYPAGGPVPRKGVFVYGDANDKWVRTRRIWNQHAYHLTNVNADGTLPKPETRSWTPGENNNYRVSSQGKGAFNAPDLKATLEISTAACPAGIELRARVTNAGTLGAKAGVPVTFHLGGDASGPVITQKVTTKALLPGESEVVSHVFAPGAQTSAFAFFVVVNGTAGAPGALNECLSDNNGGAAGGVRCPGIQ